MENAVDAVPPAPTPDPARVADLPGLAACMRALVGRRNLTYTQLARAAERLPRRDGQLVPLPRSTVSDMLSGKRLPSKDRLLTFLAACRVAPDDVPHWLAAWDRVRTSTMTITTPTTTTPTTTTAEVQPQVSQPPAKPPWWRFSRRGVVLVAVTAILSAGTTVASLWAAGAFHPADPPVVRPLRGHILTVLYQNSTHSRPDASDASHVGTVDPGPHIVYCWTVGAPLRYNGRTSAIWVRADDDIGNTDVYFSELDLYDGDSRELPQC